MRNEIRKALRSACTENFDSRTGEINFTGLAESAAINLDHPEWLDDDTHEIWDLAIVIGEAFQKRNNAGER